MQRQFNKLADFFRKADQKIFIVSNKLRIGISSSQNSHMQGKYCEQPNVRIKKIQVLLFVMI